MRNIGRETNSYIAPEKMRLRSGEKKTQFRNLCEMILTRHAKCVNLSPAINYATRIFFRGFQVSWGTSTVIMNLYLCMFIREELAMDSFTVGQQNTRTRMT